MIVIDSCFVIVTSFYFYIVQEVFNSWKMVQFGQELVSQTLFQIFGTPWDF